MLMDVIRLQVINTNNLHIYIRYKNRAFVDKYSVFIKENHQHSNLHQQSTSYLLQYP